MADSKASGLTEATAPVDGQWLYMAETNTAQKKINPAALLRYGKGQTTLYVAASNATDKSKFAADYVCDGTNDQSEIQSAIDALPTTVAGRVMLSEGNFAIAATVNVNRHGVTLEGVGWGDPIAWTEDAYSTTLTAISGITGAVIKVASGAFGTSNPVAACQIRNLMVDGRGSAGAPVGTSIVGIQFSSFSGLIQNVRTCLLSGHGVHVSGKTTATTWSTYDTRLDGIITHDNSGDGLFCDDYAEDLQINNIVSHNNAGTGINTKGSSLQVQGCHAYDNGAGTNYNIRVQSTAARVKFIGCKIEHAEGIGVLVVGAEAMFVGCNFHSNGDPSGGSTTRHLKLDASDTLVSGCRFGIKGASYSMGAAIEVTTGKTGNLISGCSFQGTYTTSTLIDTPGNTKVHGCVGLADAN